MFALSLRLFLLLSLATPFAAGAVSLDAPSRAWLEQHAEWRVGVVMGAPYAEYDQRQRRLSGFHVQLMEQLAAELGVRLQWRRFNDEAALQEAALEGRIDVAPGLRQTPAGLRLWRYSDPFLRIPRLIVGDRAGPRAVDLEYLHPSELVAAAGPGPVSEFLASNYPNITVLTAASQADALRQVLEGKASYAVVDEPLFARLSQQLEYDALAVVGDLGNPQLLRIASRRDSPELAAVLDAALRQFPAREFGQLQEQWLKPRSIDLGREVGYWRSLALLLGVLLLACLLMLAWQRRQHGLLESRLKTARRDIELREAAEEAQRLTQFCLDHSTCRHPLAQLGQPSALRQSGRRTAARAFVRRLARPAAGNLRPGAGHGCLAGTLAGRAHG